MINIIREKRRELGLTQKELAEEVGISYASIKAYESFSRTPKPSTLKKLAKVFKVPVSELIENNYVDEVISTIQSFMEKEKNINKQNAFRQLQIIESLLKNEESTGNIKSMLYGLLLYTKAFNYNYKTDSNDVDKINIMKSYKEIVDILGTFILAEHVESIENQNETNKMIFEAKQSFDLLVTSLVNEQTKKSQNKKASDD